MCGITGFIGKGVSPEICGHMVKQLHHRGPDDHGVWVDEQHTIALGHARLSILDLSPKGHQPMHSASGRYVVAFNGEIYNFATLRTELETSGFHFNGHSDTEVLLAAIEEWGIHSALKRFAGMFAIALWDRKEKCLHLVRDRLGEKPLYYGEHNGVFLFGSELKALKAHPATDFEINRDALALMLRHNYIPTPHTIYQGIHKLTPGTLLTVDCSNSQLSFRHDVYWSAYQVATKGNATPFDASPEELINELDNLLLSTIGEKMVSDVLLGAFLSGGYDSSTIVALMQAQSSRPVKTFSIGFHESGYDEAHHAKEVARHLGTEHTEFYVTPKQAMDVIPKLPSLYDEPFSDSSQIPTYLVAELTRQHVTVALSGDGGDELFAGYNRYLLAQNMWQKLDRIPTIFYRLAAGLISTLSPNSWNKLGDCVMPLLPARLRFGNIGDKLYKLADVIKDQTPEQLYQSLVSHWNHPEQILVSGKEASTPLTRPDEWPELSSYVEWMMYMDMIGYMPDDILVKVDRASMGVSLETRVPFLDHRLVEFAWRVPLSLKLKEGNGKWLLRQVLYRYVPKTLVDRPKMGFGVPIDSWLRGPLREWGESLLARDRLKSEGFFNPDIIYSKWMEHQSGSRNWHYWLWDILMFQAWLENNR